MRALDKLYRSFDRVGPTMSKVLLVTNHLWRPDLNILGESCEVGDGADEAFLYLFGARGGGDAVRKKRLEALFETITSDRVERPSGIVLCSRLRRPGVAAAFETTSPACRRRKNHRRRASSRRGQSRCLAERRLAEFGRFVSPTSRRLAEIGRVVSPRARSRPQVHALEPRLKPMVAWVAERTRAKFGCIPAGAIADSFTIYDLQVQLCEWRKFRKSIDARRSIRRGSFVY